MPIEADACILAIGQKPDLSFLTPDDGVELTPGGTIRVDPATLATSAPGVFAGGDVAFGPRNLIEAVANGKRAARSIHEYLPARARRARDARSRSRRSPTLALPDDRRLRGARPRDAADARRRPPHRASPRSRPATTATQARRQAARCLVCHVQTIYDPEKCVLCNRCVDVCPEYCLAIVPFEALELPTSGRATRCASARRGERPAARARWSRTTSAASAAACAPSAAHRRHDDGAVPRSRSGTRASEEPA